MLVRKVNRDTFEARTSSSAKPYGCSAVIKLEGQQGVWLVTALTAVGDDPSDRLST